MGPFYFYHFYGMGGQMKGDETKGITYVLWKGALVIGARTIVSMAIVMLIMNHLPILIMSLIKKF